MARPKPDLPSAEAILALADDTGRLVVKVTPGARGESIEIGEGRLLVKVRAKPKDGEANAAVQALLAEGLGIASRRVTLVKGASSREKLFRVD